jgi:predicted nucleic acid-binding protein
MSYIDTSVLVAYYCPELLSSVTQAILSRLAKPTISPLVEVEIHSAVAAKVRSGDLDRAAGYRILALLREHLDGGTYHVVSIGAREYAIARDWLGRFSTPLRTVDALHLAAAFTNNLRLLTCDQGLAKAAETLKVKHLLVG